MRKPFDLPLTNKIIILVCMIVSGISGAMADDMSAFFGTLAIFSLIGALFTFD